MCGIFGQINKKRGKFNFSAFATLGIANDSRGGDSCGIFIDGKVEYGTDGKKLFSNFLSSSKLLKNTKECHIAFGHCRKASVGLKTVEQAQPCIIKENDKIKYVVIHNGTITNYKELANKYIPGIDISKLTDSQIMTNIFYYCGYDVLKEYEGAGVFVIADYRENKPKVLIFKGGSKNIETSTDLSEERPLYFAKSGDSYLFSSIYNYLQPFSDIISNVPVNKLITIDDDFNFKIVTKYDRSNFVQNKSTYSEYVSSYYGYNKGYYDDYYDYNQYYGSNTTTKTTTVMSSKRITKDVNGLYKMNGKYISGIYYLNLNGEVTGCTSDYPCFFCSGYLLKNKDCYYFLKKFADKSGLSFEQLTLTIPETLESIVLFPNEFVSGDEHYYYEYDGNYMSMYTGELQYFGETIVRKVNYGTVTEVKQAEDKEVLKKIYLAGTKYKVDPTKLYKLIAEECNALTNTNK